MLEVNEDEEDDDDTYQDPNSQALVLYQDESSKLSEAQHLLDHILDQKDAYEKGEPLPIEPEDDSEAYYESISQVDSDAEEQKQLGKEENDLKERLQKQEDELAKIMKEIEQKENMLKEAIQESNKYIDEENTNDDGQIELSAQSAATKFSNLRGKIIRSDKVVNSAVPADKIIEEVPEEDDEEDARLDAMLNEAQNFNIDYELD